MGGAQEEHGQRRVDAQGGEDKVGEVGLLGKVEIHRLSEVCHTFLQGFVCKPLEGRADSSYQIFHFHLLIRDSLMDLGKADLPTKPRKKEAHVGRLWVSRKKLSGRLGVHGELDQTGNHSGSRPQYCAVSYLPTARALLPRTTFVFFADPIPILFQVFQDAQARI